jgi:hypothetical protein
MAVVVAVVGYALNFSWHRLGAALVFVGLCALVIYVGCCVVAVFMNRNYVADITRPDSRIHFDLNPRRGGRWAASVMGRCWVRDPNGVTTPSEPKAVGQTFWVAYPSDFPGAPPIVPGRYKATWEVERRPGKWRVLLTKRYVEPRALNGCGSRRRD